LFRGPEETVSCGGVWSPTYRATAKSVLEPLFAVPAATIRLRESIASPSAPPKFDPVPTVVVTIPPEPNAGSTRQP
jgi:hypothetical protein